MNTTSQEQINQIENDNQNVKRKQQTEQWPSAPKTKRERNKNNAFRLNAAPIRTSTLNS